MDARIDNLQLVEANNTEAADAPDVKGTYINVENGGTVNIYYDTDNVPDIYDNDDPSDQHEVQRSNDFSGAITQLKALFDAFANFMLALIQNLLSWGGQGTDTSNATDTNQTATPTSNTGTDDSGALGNQTDPIGVNEKAVVWGDPHFIDPDDKVSLKQEKGVSFDFQGQAGNSYQLLEDKGVNFVGKFEQWPQDNEKNIIGQTGLALTDGQGNTTHLIEFNKEGQAFLVQNNDERVEIENNGEPLEINGTETTFKDSVLTTVTPEYTITQESVDGKSIRAEVKTGKNGVNLDSTLPKGLLGDLFDADDNISQGVAPGDEHEYDFDALFEGIRAEAETENATDTKETSAA